MALGTRRPEAFVAALGNSAAKRARIDSGVRREQTMISQALRNEPLTVFGNGSQTRSFCYCADLIEGIYRLMMSDTNLPVNIGNPREMTILEFAQEILRATGARSKVIFKPLPQDDPKQRKPDITRARTLLHWEPKVSLQAGLEKTIAYFRDKV